MRLTVACSSCYTASKLVLHHPPPAELLDGSQPSPSMATWSHFGFFQPFRSLLSSASSPSGDPSFTSSKKTLFDPRNRTVITASPCCKASSNPNPDCNPNPITRTIKSWFHLSPGYGCHVFNLTKTIRRQHFAGDLKQNSGLGIALLSITASAKVKISPFVAMLSAFVSAVVVWFFAQTSKMVINFFIERKWYLSLLFASGGMPSSHSALCMALTTSVALYHGAGTRCFRLIVMYDGIGVRRHAGMQAEVLNLIIRDLFEGHPISQRKLKELLGHTPSQVLAAALVGVVMLAFVAKAHLVSTYDLINS
ncbi:LOW QUALITY PROTEIN: hypothetical protein HID58_070359 [Brassica napus]|uniref:Acid phosphatase/vanadium-dependent haloperoxidase-related protein n=1 Tax=Brassica napus TaxID=3708 RepID=A0ABQ7YYI4_BRANA|nr:LOW QUALITY PROTEIN: hypothetical protein HID58_070359 [Brassica napus]